jgi:integrase/recombinase XerD
MINKLSLLFFLYRSKVNSKDNMPLYCRITLNGKRKQFATGCFLKESDWDVKQSLHKGASQEVRHTNNQIKSIRKRLLHCYNMLGKTYEQPDVHDLYNSYAGKIIEERTLIGVFDHHISQIKALVGQDYTAATLGKFVLIKGHVCDFIQYQYRLNDLSLKQLNLGFLHDFDHYLKVQKKQNQNTVNKTIERVKKILKISVAHGWLSHDPFALFRKKRFVKELVFLNAGELTLLENGQLLDRLNTVRNLFLFSCYTGLAYYELSTLTKAHLKKDKKGILWIEMIRRKTKRRFSVIVLPKALKILEYYSRADNNGLLLPSISNQKLNVYLKELATTVGISKHLTHHIARKTFAATVLLDNDIPIDVASFMLGHSKISTTEEFYAKVQRDRVILHMAKLC